MRLTGYVESDTAYRVLEPHGFQKVQNRLQLDLDADLAGSLRLRAIGRLLYDPRRLLVGPDPDYEQEPIDRWQVAGTRSTEAELRELYLDWRGRLGPVRLDVRAGKQQVVWGQAFGLRILDVVNALDYREFILDDFVDARIPSLALRVEGFWRGWSFEAFALPDFEPDRLADPSSEFALDPELPGFLPAFREIPASPLVPEPFPFVVLEDEDVPRDWRFSNTGWGLRVGRYWKGFDLSLHYRDAYDPTIAFERRIEEREILVTVAPGVTFPVTVPVNRLQPDHVRVRTLGAAFATARGSFALWGEGALSFGRAFSVDDLDDPDGIVRRPDLQYVLGVDWNGLDPLFASVQWIHRVVVRHRSSIGVDHSSEFLSLLLRYGLRQETIVAQFFGIVGFDEGDTMLRPSVEWKATDRFSITVGADVFTGAREGVFGQFAHERECLLVPEVAPLPQAGGCFIEVRSGRPSRVFLRLRYAFDLAL